MNQSEKLQNKLIEDESFILWVYTKNDPKWSAWLASNPDKKDIVENAKRIILSMKFKSEVPSKDRIDYIKNRIEDNIILLENRSSSSSVLWSPWIRRAAALLFLVSFIATMYFVINNTSTSTVHEVAIKHIEKSTQKGQKLTTFLPDGSRVMLNSNSKISYIQSFHDAERVVMLEGEAFFEIEKDTLRPFKVISNGITTTALGTSFNIDCRAGEKVEVSLVSGKVAV
ncbi:MAG: FecR domain-containing protein, partial [Cyclobacteriaceae bacterium]|nr:FecR domain-containing protein [Cyclobacteriaceae bacterium]